MLSLILVLFFSVIVNNVVFNQVYGICPFLGVSKKTDQAIGMGLAVTFVMVMASMVTWPIRYFVLEKFNLGYLETIVFILVIATLVQFLEMVLKKYIPGLHKSLGIYLPLITTNCAVLGVTVDNVSAGFAFLPSLFSALGSGIGFLLAMFLFSVVRMRLDDADCPKAWKGLPITLAGAAIVSMCFKGFEGLVSIPTKKEHPELYFSFEKSVTAEDVLISILVAVAVVGIIALFASLLLCFAQKTMAVKENENIEKVRACLPGANCGSCGFAGCDSYAKALCEKEGIEVNLCVPGGDKVASEIATILGKKSEKVEKKMAVVLCDGNAKAATLLGHYEGEKSCAAAKLFYGGPNVCAFGCIGYGDCVKACPNDAICVVNGVSKVHPDLCVGCGKCIDACPQNIIRIVKKEAQVTVTCQNLDAGAMARKACMNSCIGCKKCEKVCPSGAVSVINNLARVDNSKCTQCYACVENCPTGAISYLDENLARHRKIVVK